MPPQQLSTPPVRATQGATRALPVHQQEATDEQGRRRFHGAFTGGFSAGYFNTVGSKVRPRPASAGPLRSPRLHASGAARAVPRAAEWVGVLWVHCCAGGL